MARGCAEPEWPEAGRKGSADWQEAGRKVEPAPCRRHERVMGGERRPDGLWGQRVGDLVRTRMERWTSDPEGAADQRLGGKAGLRSSAL